MELCASGKPLYIKGLYVVLEYLDVFLEHRSVLVTEHI